MTTRLAAIDRQLRATVTPLASIFGSGFLIIVPVLQRALGGAAVLGAAAVCSLAWVVGNAIRHNIRTVEPLVESGDLDRTITRLETLSDALICVAYVISVALYLRIMSQYLVNYLAGDPSAGAERVITMGAVVAIAAIGVSRGFSGLDTLERFALGAVLVMTGMLGTTLAVKDIAQITVPATAGIGLGHTLLLLGGVLITVQGFETVRYLHDRYDRTTRVRASQLSQLIATAVYISLVALATPLMASHGHDNDLLDLVRRTIPAVALPLVVGAVLSQFSAAIADTVAAHGNLGVLAPRMGERTPYVLIAAAASALSWVLPTLTLVVVASRAFAAYYCIQSVVAMRTSEGLWRTLGFGTLALALAAITVFAQPVG